MKTLVIGANGATGSHVVNQLLESGQKTKIIVRKGANIKDNWAKNSDATIITASITEVTSNEMADYIKDCPTLISCLGHNMSWQGIYGKPAALVTNAIKLLTDAIFKNKPKKPVHLILMNTAGYRDADAGESVSTGGRLILPLLRSLVPPHADNENAAEYLKKVIGPTNPYIEWVIVRPVALINSSIITGYNIEKSPLRNSIFNSDKTSRLNVADFMNQLTQKEDLWNNWKGKMPVISDS